MPSKKTKPVTAGLYPNYTQAKMAVRKLKVRSQTHYHKVAKKDKRLPYNPSRVYHGKGWVNWYSFLGKSKPAFYTSYKKAAQAVRRLFIKSAAQYKSGHKKDKRLPSHPDEFYNKKGWKGWHSFLGKK